MKYYNMLILICLITSTILMSYGVWGVYKQHKDLNRCNLEKEHIVKYVDPLAQLAFASQTSLNLADLANSKNLKRGILQEYDNETK